MPTGNSQEASEIQMHLYSGHTVLPLWCPGSTVLSHQQKHGICELSPLYKQLHSPILLSTLGMATFQHQNIDRLLYELYTSGGTFTFPCFGTRVIHINKAI